MEPHSPAYPNTPSETSKAQSTTSESSCTATSLEQPPFTKLRNLVTSPLSLIVKCKEKKINPMKLERLAAKKLNPTPELLSRGSTNTKETNYWSL